MESKIRSDDKLVEKRKRTSELETIRNMDNQNATEWGTIQMCGLSRKSARIAKKREKEKKEKQSDDLKKAKKRYELESEENRKRIKKLETMLLELEKGTIGEKARKRRCYEADKKYAEEQEERLKLEKKMLEAGQIPQEFLLYPNGGEKKVVFAKDCFGTYLGIMDEETKAVNFDSQWLYPIKEDQKNIVEICMQGSRKADFSVGYKEANITEEEAEGYTWHHMYDLKEGKSGECWCTMQLVDSSKHLSVHHVGAVDQWRKLYGKEYQ